MLTNPAALPPGTVRIVKLALEEDQSAEDLTTQWAVPPDHIAAGYIRAKSSGLISGIDVVAEVYRQVDAQVRVAAYIEDGQQVEPGRVLASVEGPTRSILTGERTALNFLQHMSGISTLTARFVEAVRPNRAVVRDTRKTVPGLRVLDKYSVHCGGATNHRPHLAAMILLKDNHMAAAGGAAAALEAVNRHIGTAGPIEVELEVSTVEEARHALDWGVAWVLLDNMSVAQMRQVVEMRDAVRGPDRSKLEASGGVSLNNVAAVAATGVDAISIGALTHSAPALDINLTIEQF